MTFKSLLLSYIQRHHNDHFFFAVEVSNELKSLIQQDEDDIAIVDLDIVDAVKKIPKKEKRDNIYSYIADGLLKLSYKGLLVKRETGGRVFNKKRVEWSLPILATPQPEVVIPEVVIPEVVIPEPEVVIPEVATPKPKKRVHKPRLCEVCNKEVKNMSKHRTAKTHLDKVAQQ